MMTRKIYKLGETIPAKQPFIVYDEHETRIVIQHEDFEIGAAPFPPRYELIDLPELPPKPKSRELKIGHWYVMRQKDDNAIYQYCGKNKKVKDVGGEKWDRCEEYEIGDEWVKVKR